MTDFCNNCGLCCMHMRTPPFITDDYNRLPPELKAEVDEFPEGPRYAYYFRNIEHDAPCFWLDLVTGQCRHYEHRPDACRDYEVGSDGCRLLRKEVGLTVNGMPIPEDSDLTATRGE